MFATTFVSLGEYLNIVYRPDCEYIDGELLARNVGEWDHSPLQMLLSGFLMNREEQWGILVVPEQRVQVRPTRFRVPISPSSQQPQRAGLSQTLHFSASRFFRRTIA